MRYHALLRHAGAVLLSASLAACSSWQVQDVTPAQVFQGKPPERLRVTRGDTSRLVLTHPRLGTDSLTGEMGNAAVAIPLGDIQVLELRKGDLGKTMSLVGGITAAMILVGTAAMEDCCGAGVTY